MATKSLRQVIKDLKSKSVSSRSFTTYERCELALKGDIDNIIWCLTVADDERIYDYNIKNLARERAYQELQSAHGSNTVGACHAYIEADEEWKQARKILQSTNLDEV